jgi:hypothetical protein
MKAVSKRRGYYVVVNAEKTRAIGRIQAMSGSALHQPICPVIPAHVIDNVSVKFRIIGTGVVENSVPDIVNDVVDQLHAGSLNIDSIRTGILSVGGVAVHDLQVTESYIAKLISFRANRDTSNRRVGNVRRGGRGVNNHMLAGVGLNGDLVAAGTLKNGLK